MIRVLIISLILLSINSTSYAQGLNNLWLMGRGGLVAIYPGGGLTIDFNSGNPTFSTLIREMEFTSTHANISDSNGNLLFYTNGAFIANALDDTMQNGGRLNPSQYTFNHNDGLHLRQANVIIPKPESDSLYYLFHSTIDTMNPTYLTLNLYNSIIDMSKNMGLGEVIEKNKIIISDNLNVGKMVAVKHGNGRDYWIVLHKRNTNIFYKLLITPNGIDSITTQSIGVIRDFDAGQAKFSRDGSKYAYYFSQSGVEIFDFDRCTGLLSNPVHFNLNTPSGEGIEFSPNSEVLYVSTTDSLFQFDITSSNILSTKQLVAAYDSFLYILGSLQLETWLALMELAPDGKIYITTGNGTQYMHVIEQPNNLGAACIVQQHNLFLPRLYFNTLPNHPNHHLGPLVGSVCDTITTGISPPEERLTLKLYPNPNSGTFQITYTPLQENLKLQVFNILGEVVHTQLLPQWSQLQNITVPNLSAGVYMATITSSASKKSVKFVVE